MSEPLYKIMLVSIVSHTFLFEKCTRYMFEEFRNTLIDVIRTYM